MDAHFDKVKANFIRCEDCKENFFFDFLRHPRYFVTHFKSCHLKNLLYRFNGFSEEENQKICFGPRRKKDANAWFSQLKSTEKRMISMQDNKWSEISERDCWSCRLCSDGRADLTHVFELDENGRTQALLHLRQAHENVYDALLQDICQADASGGMASHADAQGSLMAATDSALLFQRALHPNLTSRTAKQRLAEAERSRLRRLKATPEEKQLEALRSRKRREKLTPAQRQADYDRRKKKKKRMEESERSKKRREEATEEMKHKEVLRSRERRRTATEEQRRKEALRSKRRRENATEEQKLKERERCRRRYEKKKLEKQKQRLGEAASAMACQVGLSTSIQIPNQDHQGSSSMSSSPSPSPLTQHPNQLLSQRVLMNQTPTVMQFGGSSRISQSPGTLTDSMQPMPMPMPTAYPSVGPVTAAMSVPVPVPVPGLRAMTDSNNLGFASATVASMTTSQFAMPPMIQVIPSTAVSTSTSALANSLQSPALMAIGSSSSSSSIPFNAGAVANQSMMVSPNAMNPPVAMENVTVDRTSNRANSDIIDPNSSSSTTNANPSNGRARAQSLDIAFV